jgi:hypothetical protein
MIGPRITTTSAGRKPFLDPSPIPESTHHDNGSLRLSLVRWKYLQMEISAGSFGDLGERRSDKPVRKPVSSVTSLVSV